MRTQLIPNGTQGRYLREDLFAEPGARDPFVSVDQVADSTDYMSDCERYPEGRARYNCPTSPLNL